MRDGKIVWLDMGMMGTLTERERKLVGQAVSGVARGDVGLCRDAVLGLGEFRGKTDKRQLYRDIEGLLDQYGTADLGSMDLAKVFEDLTDVMKRNGISMPSSLTMLARGLATIEGRRRRPQPEINVMNVVTARMGSQLLRNIDWRGEIVRDAQAVYASAHKSLEIPSLMADILRTGLKGEANLGVEHHVGGRHGAPHAGYRFEALRRARRRCPARLRRAAARRRPAGGRSVVAHRLLLPSQRRPARVGVRAEGSKK